MNRLFRRLILTLLLALPLPALAAPVTGYWWNPAAGGSGFVIEVQGNTMFLAGFLYAASGEATWVASTGPMTSTTQYSGVLITFTGGQTLTGSYATPHQSAPLGMISITFSDDTHASLTWPGGTEPITRYDFGPGGSESPQPDGTAQAGWWWNQNEGGRGFAIEIQGNALYFAGYMYDATGNPVWYLSTGNMTNPTLYQGVWQQFAGGPALTGPYKAPTTANANVGSISLQFESPGQATLTLPDGRQIPFVRYTFGLAGPALNTLSVASAAPATPLLISGSGIDTSAALSLTFFDNAGYSATVPLAAASATSIQTGVPPYVNAATGAFGSGAVFVKLTQASLGVSVDSNVLGGFTIQPMPTVPAALGPPGTLTLAMLRAELAQAQQLKTLVSSSSIGSGALVTAVAQQITDLKALVNDVQGVVQGASFSLGTVDGANINITPGNIGGTDQIILAGLNMLATSPAGGAKKTAAAASTACGQQEASAAVADIEDANIAAIQQALQNYEQAFNTSPKCGTVPEVSETYVNFMGLAGVVLAAADDSAHYEPGDRQYTALGALIEEFEGSQLVLYSETNPSLSGQLAQLQVPITEQLTLESLILGEFATKVSLPYKNYLNDAVVPQFPANPYFGRVDGTWQGTCQGTNVWGMVSMTLDSGGGVTAKYSFDRAGSFAGGVNSLGFVTAPSTTGAGSFSWSGQLKLTPGTYQNIAYNRFIGSSGTFTDKVTCDGVWSVN